MTSAPHEEPPQTPSWRSRAFVQPLLVTIVGVAAPPIVGVAALWTVLLAQNLLVGAPPDSSSPCTGECGTASLAGALMTGIAFLFVWCAVMLVAGFVVGWSSRDSRLASRAILAAVVGLALMVSIVYTIVSTTSESLLDTVFIFLGLAVVPLIPVALGFVVGRSLKKPASTGASPL